MKNNRPIEIKGRHYTISEVPWFKFYPFFLFFLGMWGYSGFEAAYWVKDPEALLVFTYYFHGAIAIILFTYLYLGIYGLDEVKWMFINAGLGLLGIYSQIDWLLSLFGAKASDFPIYVHVIPGLYYILNTFLIRQVVIDLFKAREGERRQDKEEESRARLCCHVRSYLCSHLFLGKTMIRTNQHTLPKRRNDSMPRAGFG